MCAKKQSKNYAKTMQKRTYNNDCFSIFKHIDIAKLNKSKL